MLFLLSDMFFPQKISGYLFSFYSCYSENVTSSLGLIFDRPEFKQRRRQWHPTPVLLPGKSHGWRSLVGCRLWGRTESDRTERLHFYFSLSCIGGGNGNPLQCSCLENPRDRGALWAAVYGVTQSWTRLKRLSSSSSMHLLCLLHWQAGSLPLAPPGKPINILLFG